MYKCKVENCSNTITSDRLDIIATFISKQKQRQGDIGTITVYENELTVPLYTNATAGLCNY